MLIHHTFALSHRQGVPGTRLHKRIDEQVLLILGSNHQAWIMSATCVFSDVDRTLGHGKEGVRLAQVWSQRTTTNAAAYTLQVFNGIGSLPQHEVTVGTQPV